MTQIDPPFRPALDRRPLKILELLLQVFRGIITIPITIFT